MSPCSSWVIESELSRVIGALKASSKNKEVDELIEKLSAFKSTYSQSIDDSQEFLRPFLEVVRTDPVTSPVTGLALDSINKFIVYGYIHEGNLGSLEAQDLAVTVAHAKFVGVDTSSDEGVLMKVLQVLRSLMLSPVGRQLSDESVLEVLHSTFRMCMENLLSELLRKMAETVLLDMIRVLFGRLSTLSAKDESFLPSLKRLKMNNSVHPSWGAEQTWTHRSKRGRHRRPPKPPVKPEAEAPTKSGVTSDASIESAQSASEIRSDEEGKTEISEAEDQSHQEPPIEETKEFVNQQGITFMVSNAEVIDESGSLIAYGVPCVRELFRFLIGLINPYESNVGAATIEVALNLLSTALESGGRNIEKFDSLLNLVKDDLSKNVTRLVSSESRSIFSSNLFVAFLIFSLFRRHLKFQLELFFQKLMDVITSESIKVLYEQKETALDLVVRLYRLPGFITQVYLNYDCDIYTSNIFEDLTKMLSKNTFPLMGLHSTHFLSLDALLAVVESIEAQCHKRMLGVKKGGHLQSQGNDDETSKKLSNNTLTHEQLMALKHKKKLISTATEQFNTKPSKGITFMQEAGLFQNPLDPVEVATFLRENPHLDKKQLGDYISNRKNLNILGAFVKSFDFEQLRIDEALRLFLETFRLPGEAPLITLIMEHFADHWQKSNGDPLSSSDSAFTLAYAVIMLNVDQHNVNHTKKNDPMTIEQFCRNLRGTNGGDDHNEEMLGEVYHNIRNNEIVMPAEQSGVVKENYLWKCVLKRGFESDFLESPNGTFDHELFGIIWGPTIAALSYVFDKAPPENHTLNKSLGGFQKCATIAAHYSMIDVFDNLIISLCKFTTLLSVEHLNKNSPFLVSYGSNEKALSATRLVVSLVIKYGDILREGWKNIMECVLQLFRAGLLPENLTHSEDYLDPKGIDLLNREDEDKSAKVESGFLNSFVSFISMASEQQNRVRTPEEEEAVKLASNTVSNCNLESILTESKFLVEESLSELVRALIKSAESFLSPPPPVSEDGEVSPLSEDPYDEKALLFFNEILVRVTIENRDRVHVIWNRVVDHFCKLISESNTRSFLKERVVTNILRLCVRLARKEDLVSLVLRSGLKVLLSMRQSNSLSRITSYGLYELLRNNAANIHESVDWAIVFDLMDIVGAGITLIPKEEDQDSGQGESDSSKEEEWIVLGENGSVSPSFSFKELGKKVKSIAVHDSPSFLKCCESVSFLVRDVAHITPQNFESVVSTLRLFVEAAYFGIKMDQGSVVSGTPRSKRLNRPIRRVKSAPNNFSSTDPNYDADESDNENSGESGELRDGEYHHVSLRLLDLMHTLHSRAGSVYEAWGMSVDLWSLVWCPLLQGMARLCCDHRAQIRTSALTALQRSLLHTDLRKGMNSKEWESAFTSVLFPMLSRLLKIQAQSSSERHALEETKTRAATLLGKVFLQHLTPLTELSTFNALWLTILDFMEKFIKSANTDVLGDAIPESLKNMLLVMDTAGTFTDPENGSPAPLWGYTWDKLHVFLPDLMSELFGSQERKAQQPLEEATPIIVPKELIGDAASTQAIQSKESGDISLDPSGEDPAKHILSQSVVVEESTLSHPITTTVPPPMTIESKESIVLEVPQEKEVTPVIDTKDLDNTAALPQTEEAAPILDTMKPGNTSSFSSMPIGQEINPLTESGSEVSVLDPSMVQPELISATVFNDHKEPNSTPSSMVQPEAIAAAVVNDHREPDSTSMVQPEVIVAAVTNEESESPSSMVQSGGAPPPLALLEQGEEGLRNPPPETSEEVPLAINQNEPNPTPILKQPKEEVLSVMEQEGGFDLKIPDSNILPPGYSNLPVSATAAPPLVIPPVHEPRDFRSGPPESTSIAIEPYPSTIIGGSAASSSVIPPFLHAPPSSAPVVSIPLVSLGIIPPPPVVSISQPPPGILFPPSSASTGFQPIHAAEPPGGPEVPLANPKALLPPQSNPSCDMTTNYFNGPPLPSASTTATSNLQETP